MKTRRLKQIITCIAIVSIYSQLYTGCKGNGEKTTLDINVLCRQIKKVVANCRTNELEALIRGDKHIVIECDKKHPLVYHAVRNDCDEIIRMLVEQGASVNRKTKDHLVALHESVRTENIETTKLLIEYGGNVNVRSETGATPLDVASKSGNKELVALLLDKGAVVESKSSNEMDSIDVATYFDKIEILDSLVQESNPSNYDNFSPLCYSVSKESLNLLIRAGYSCNGACGNGTSPLHLARSAEIANILIEKGAIINAKDDDGMTPLHHAVITGKSNVVIELLRSGADVQIVDRKGRTPLHYAVMRKNKLMKRNRDYIVKEILITKILVENGANCRIKDHYGVSPYMIADENREKNTLSIFSKCKKIND